MSQQTIAPWERMRTPETRQVEDLLRKQFPKTDAYRYNSAAIRLRIVDEQFEELSNEKRYDLVESLLDTLPEETQRDIITLMIFAPSELQHSTRAQLMNLEFNDPSPSSL